MGRPAETLLLWAAALGAAPCGRSACSMPALLGALPPLCDNYATSGQVNTKNIHFGGGSARCRAGGRPAARPASAALQDGGAQGPPAPEGQARSPPPAAEPPQVAAGPPGAGTAETEAWRPGPARGAAAGCHLPAFSSQAAIKRRAGEGKG